MMLSYQLRSKLWQRYLKGSTKNLPPGFFYVKQAYGLVHAGQSNKPLSFRRLKDVLYRKRSRALTKRARRIRSERLSYEFARVLGVTP